MPVVFPSPDGSVELLLIVIGLGASRGMFSTHVRPRFASPSDLPVVHSASSSLSLDRIGRESIEIAFDIAACSVQLYSLPQSAVL